MRVLHFKGSVSGECQKLYPLSQHLWNSEAKIPTLLFKLKDWPFDDGAPPPNQIVDDWLSLLKNKFREEPGCCVAVHCVAGLGRAPVLVALALIECGMKYEDAVQFIRQKRRGAFNSKQLLYLEKYRPKMRLRFRDTNGHCCVQ
ncbi:protein tyrosine phosphatase type IVA 2 isoform X2 [Ornithorhynchus anatinus]|uniref:protein tyrosine phosphatase type IVA 2 isoform X2 n=1 Tax=Ornithorhynchus anatinus TaxID=9258 RepID=UPI0010A7A27B|nr:protein tyrosine phosphatase type IVA 2 isoform X2 [Ornithorhynchus anatinus]